MKHLKVLVLISILIFTGCNNSITEVEDQALVADEQTVEEQKIEEEVVNQETEVLKVTGEYSFGDYKITLPNQWTELEKTEIDGLSMWSLESDKGIVLQLSVAEDHDKVVNEDSIKEEVELDSYLVLVEESNTVVDETSFYGAYIEDHATETQFFYNLAKVESKVIAVIFNNPRSFTDADVEMMNQIIDSFNIK